MSNYCAEPFQNIYIEELDELHIAPCCVALTKKSSNTDLFNDGYLEEIRQYFLEDKKHPACDFCWKAEDAGLGSRRLSQAVETKLKTIDYWTGNLCNLKCVICGPNNSSAWKKDMPALKEFILQKDYDYKSSEFWKNLDTSNIEWLHFTGGEPLINVKCEEFLKTLKNPQNITLVYNTNAITTPSTRILNIWKKFKCLEIYLSIDDLYERFEYQRFPGKWQDLEQNIKLFKQISNVNLSVNITVSMLNIFYLKEILSWIKSNELQFNIQTAFGHTELNLSDSMKKILEVHLKGYDDLVTTTKQFDTQQFITFMNYILSLDKIRHNSYSTTHPKWFKILKEEYDRICIR